MRIAPLATTLWCAQALACGGAQTDNNGARSASGVQGPTANVPVGDANSPTTTTSLTEPGAAPSQRLTEARSAPIPASAGSAALATATAHGHDAGRGPEDIRAIIAAHRGEARACYDQALAAAPEMEGDLVLQWTIDPKGTVTHVSADPVRSQISNEQVIGCIADRISKIQFASSPGGFETKASYPFNFHPRHGAGQPK